MGEVDISVDKDALTGGTQISINGDGTGYRLCGPKYSGNSKPLIRKVLTERDATEIRRYLDKAFPPDPAATMKEVVDVLQKIPNALNSEFSAGCEEREGGSERRQERLSKPGRELRDEARALLAKLEGK